MRFVRLAALYGSLILLVATAVSVGNRRGDLAVDQAWRAEQAVTIASSSARRSIAQVRQNVHLAGEAFSGGTDNRDYAEQMVRSFAGAEACVGATAAGCTGADLLALDAVGDLAAESERQPNADAPDDGERVASAIDAATESMLVVRRTSSPGSVNTVVMRVPLESLITGDAREVIERDEALLEVAPGREQADARTEIDSSDGRRIGNVTIAAPFSDGSVVVTASVDGSVGIVGDQPVRYGVLLLLGTVLLALAGWTFLVERRHLERRATTDELTGLINRREFERISEVELDVADRLDNGLCVMVVDLNGFKQVNDTLGHQFGDLVLAASSERLVAAVRDTDVVGRWGGDEFVILLPGLAERGAVRKSAERIWHSLADSPVVGDTTMTASIGAAIFPRHGTSLDALMRAADVAMYEAKTTGVSHRIADTIALSESLMNGSDDSGSFPIVDVVTDGYIGPDRRFSPVPSPLTAPAEFADPVAPSAPLATPFPAPTGDAAAEPSRAADETVDPLSSAR